MKKVIVTKRILLSLVILVMLLSVLGKFIGREPINMLYGQANLSDQMIHIAALQLITVICLIYKPLRNLGVLLGSTVLGGVIFLMCSTGNNPIIAISTLIILWIAYKLDLLTYWRYLTRKIEWIPKKETEETFRTCQIEMKDGVYKC